MVGVTNDRHVTLVGVTVRLLQHAFLCGSIHPLATISNRWVVDDFPAALLSKSLQVPITA